MNLSYPPADSTAGSSDESYFAVHLRHAAYIIYVAKRSVDARNLELTKRTHLGSHEITALLGKGGMGEVYRARDLKLKREVAIKLLPDEFSRG